MAVRKSQTTIEVAAQDAVNTLDVTSHVIEVLATSTNDPNQLESTSHVIEVLACNPTFERPQTATVTHRLEVATGEQFRVRAQLVDSPGLTGYAIADACALGVHAIKDAVAEDGGIRISTGGATCFVDLCDTPNCIVMGQVLRGDAGANNLEFIPVGTEGQVLTLVDMGAGALQAQWATGSGGGGSTTWVGLTDTPGSITANALVQGNAAGNAIAFTGITAIGGNLTGVGTLNGVDVIGHVSATNNPHAVTIDQVSPLTTRGDLLTHDGTNNIRLGVGTVDQVPIAQADGSIAWGAQTGLATTVFDAYDASGGQSVEAASTLTLGTTRKNTGEYTYASNEVTFTETGTYKIDYRATLEADTESQWAVWLEVDTGSGFAEVPGSRARAWR